MVLNILKAKEGDESWKKLEKMTLADFKDVPWEKFYRYVKMAQEWYGEPAAGWSEDQAMEFDEARAELHGEIVAEVIKNNPETLKGIDEDFAATEIKGIVQDALNEEVKKLEKETEVEDKESYVIVDETGFGESDPRFHVISENEEAKQELLEWASDEFITYDEATKEHTYKVDVTKIHEKGVELGLGEEDIADVISVLTEEFKEIQSGKDKFTDETTYNKSNVFPQDGHLSREQAGDQRSFENCPMDGQHMNEDSVPYYYSKNCLNLTDTKKGVRIDYDHPIPPPQPGMEDEPKGPLKKKKKLKKMPKTHLKDSPRGPNQPYEWIRQDVPEGPAMMSVDHQPYTTLVNSEDRIKALNIVDKKLQGGEEEDAGRSDELDTAEDLAGKRVFIVHGWDGSPEEAWLSWLNKELTSRGADVHALTMPDAENPKIDTWIPHLAKKVDTVDENTYFVGHSLGGQTIMRYLESVDSKIGGAILVASSFSLKPGSLESKEEEEIAEPWFETEIDLEKVKRNVNEMTVIFSDNDPYAPLEDSGIFKDELGAKIVVEKNKGHFTESDVKDLPVVLKELLNLVGEKKTSMKHLRSSKILNLINKKAGKEEWYSKDIQGIVDLLMKELASGDHKRAKESIDTLRNLLDATEKAIPEGTTETPQ